MSRPRQTKESREAAAKDAFRLEIKLRRVRFDMTQGELADKVDMNRSVLSRFIADPDRFRVDQLRKIIHTLDLNPVTILAFLGYEPKAIQSLALKSESTDA